MGMKGISTKECCSSQGGESVKVQSSSQYIFHDSSNSNSQGGFAGRRGTA
ncbi:hypothetical protein HPP92_018831 [Vanilla planifolia]|uniref:Uncharacterized protein n=1 Tax=Vanilla planifolia TaxID=51239 RepID=A0A835QBC3_VANPL|nr:hypothetical protein HPP92_018831 [Vanilla planifolia]